jgi:hypothetical protein
MNDIWVAWPIGIEPVGAGDREGALGKAKCHRHPHLHLKLIVIMRFRTQSV